jgi:hypothetical protein
MFGLSVWGFMLLLGGAPGVWGAPVTTVLNNGDPANRVDIAILGDGYTAVEMSQYATHVQRLLQGLFAQEPFREYQGYFNVHRIDVLSAESGADHPEANPPVFKNTALGATYACAGVPQLICVDVSAALTIAAESLSAAQRDIILVLVNDPTYGGSGGAIAVASTHSAVVELVLHELGHSFGLLADEYGGPPPPACDAAFEPPEANVAKDLIKWASWIDFSTSIPTYTTAPSVPGLYQGAKYCDSNLFRPTYNSKMRSLGVPYEQINREQLVKRIYNWVLPIDQWSPAATAVRLMRGQSQTFAVATPAPRTHALTVAWVLDGQLQSTSAVFTLNSLTLAPGTHRLEVLVADPTPMVRNDPNQLLRAGRVWTVEVIGQPRMSLSLNQTAFRTGDTLRVGLGVQNPDTAFTADFYFGVILPDGVTVLFVTSLSPFNGVVTRLDADPRTFRPLLANVQLAQGFDTTFKDFFAYLFAGGEPPGTYTVFAALTPPGAFNDGRMDPGDLLVIDTRPFSFSP